MAVEIFGADWIDPIDEDSANDPMWWVEALWQDLQARLDDVALYDSYYRGDHPLPWLAPQAQDAFKRILQMTRTNYMGLVVDAMTERLEVTGFRVGDSEQGDKEAWRIWQANNLDSGSVECFVEAAKVGCSYLMVEPNPDDPTTPRVTVEHPAQFIIGYEPDDVRKRAAALKVWVDHRRNVTMATLYMPDAIYKFVGTKHHGPRSWIPRIVPGEDWPAPNPLGVVPAVEIRNNPQSYYIDHQLLYMGTSEIADVIDIQDRINKTIADRLMTQDFGAFPQKWATNWPNDEDDEASQATVEDKPPVDIGRNRLLVAPEGVQFGQFNAASLDPYSTAKNEDVKDIAARTRTPAQYLLGEMVNISAEALQAAESGLVSKINQRQRPFAEALEETVRLYLRAAGDMRADDTGTETLWKRAEYRGPAQITDAVIKRRQAGLTSWEQSMEDLDYTPGQIERNKRALAKEAAEAAARAMLLAAAQNPAPDEDEDGQAQVEGAQPPQQQQLPEARPGQ